MRHGVLAFLLVLLHLLPAPPVSAESWTTWTDGYNVWDIAVDGDYLWCGSSGGVVRWDLRDMSYRKFSSRDGLRGTVVRKIAVAPDGAIWACSAEGVSCFREGKWSPFNLPAGRYSDGAYDVAFAPDGAVWFARDGSISVFRDGQFTSYPFGSGSIAIASDGTVWVGTASGLYRFIGGIWEKNVNPDQSFVAVDNSIAIGHDGSVWCGSTAGLSRFKDGVWTQYGYEEGMGAGSVYDVFVDRHGIVWASGVILGLMGGGIVGGGLYRYDGTEWTEALSYTADTVAHLVSIAEDTTGNLWFAGSRDGLIRWDGERWDSYLTDDRLSFRSVQSLAVGPDGIAWIGAYEFINRFDGAAWDAFNQKGEVIPFNTRLTNGSIYLPVYSITAVSGDETWFGVSGGVLHRHGSEWTLHNRDSGFSWGTVYSIVRRGDETCFGTPEGVACRNGLNWSLLTPPDWGVNTYARALATGPSGELWVGTGSDGVFCLGDGGWTHYTEADGLAGNSVTAISLTTDGVVWIGTANGVSRFGNGRWTTYTTENGIPSNTVSSVSAVPDGAVWVGTNAGAAFFDGVSWRTRTTADGLADNQVRCIAVGSDGAVWFGTGAGLSRLVPDPVTGIEQAEAVPSGFAVLGNRPNPFNPSTTISFTLPRTEAVTLNVFDITGRNVRELVSGNLPAGTHQAVWDGRDGRGNAAASGIYFVRLKAGSHTASRRMVLVK